MIRTIVLGSCVQVQGQYVRDLKDGKVAVKVGDRIYTGVPVQSRAA